MALGKDRRPRAAASSPARSTYKWLLIVVQVHRSLIPMHKKVLVKQLRKKMVKLREQVNLMKEIHKRDRAEVEEKERECALRRKWNDLASKDNSCIQRGIVITLEIVDAEDEHDDIKVNVLRHTLREMVAEHIEAKVGLLTGGQE